jgi:nucleotide-binding universal stress UspA family protein
MVRIVVGVDGSAQSKQALRWALGEARLQGASLRIVYTWKIPIYVVEGLAPVEAIPDPTALSEAAQRRLDSIVYEITGGATDVPIEQVVVEGKAAEILVDESKGASLLVVGSRGHGGFAGLLLGSVSQQCATHASCPVVIIRGAAA